MQALVHYSDDSSPEPSNQAGPSRLRDEISTASPSNLPRKIQKPSGIVIPPKSPRRQRISSPAPTSTSIKLNSKSKSKSKSSTPLPENLTHTAQSDISKSELASTSQSTSKWGNEFEGLTEDEVFKVVTMPNGEEEDWGIPPEVNPEDCDDALKAKVKHFLKLKFENGEHINTRLLSSSAFANPHIYSKLVEFVSIDERSTNFPSSGWLTRRNLESLIPIHGPSSLSNQQKAKQEAVKASQGIGQRREINFAPGKHKDKDEGKKRDRNGWEKDDRYPYGRDRDRHRDKDRDRDRDRKRDRK